MSALSVTINAEDLFAAAAGLDRYDGAALNALLTRAVHETAAAFDSKTRRAMNAGLNLSDGYISSRLDLDTVAGVPRATLTAAGPGRPSRFGLTIVGHYAPEQVTAAAPRAAGDPKRGIGAGRKSIGVSVEVTRGQRKPIAGAFTMTLNKGTINGDKVGVFVRDPGAAKPRHLYGVSPYSAFRAQINEGTGVFLAGDLQGVVIAAIDAL